MIKTHTNNNSLLTKILPRTPGHLIGVYFSASCLVEIWWPANCEEWTCVLEDNPRKCSGSQTTTQGDVLGLDRKLCRRTTHRLLRGHLWNVLQRMDEDGRQLHSSAQPEDKILVIGGGSERTMGGYPWTRVPLRRGRSTSPFLTCIDRLYLLLFVVSAGVIIWSL